MKLSKLLKLMVLIAIVGGPLVRIANAEMLNSDQITVNTTETEEGDDGGEGGDDDYEE